MTHKIPYNKPFMSGQELTYIKQAVESGKISGDGMFSKKCHAFFEERYGFKKALLTTSCTDALEMAAILLNIEVGDEVIMPSYTFVSTANPFVLRGANIKFVDSLPNHPNMDVSKVEALITSKTKAIICVHYAGMACDMDALMAICEKHKVELIEDAAQAIESTYKGKQLGTFGSMASFSFHETKNIISGEGGLLGINDEKYALRAEIIREKGTNRSQFFRGEVDKYGWVDIGSSFLPSEIIAAFLFAQLEMIETIQAKRVAIWERYAANLESLSTKIGLPQIPQHAVSNGHIFHVICQSIEDRDALILFLKERGFHAVFHYLSLHTSPFFKANYDGSDLPFTDFYSERLLRLPLFYELELHEVDAISEAIKAYYQ